MKRLVWTAALVAALAAPALADLKPGEKEKGPDAQGQGNHDGAADPQTKNPLPEIVEKMKDVERRLAETDTGSWSQEEQKRIAEALEIEGGVVDRLQKLIEEIESQAQQGGGGGGGEQQKRPQQGKQQREPQQSKRERGQDGQEKPVDPNAGKQQQKDQKQQQDAGQNRQDQKQQQGDQQSTDYKLEKQRTANAGESWGNLPPKQAREASAARRREPPLEWRKQIEDYFRKLQQDKRK